MQKLAEYYHDGRPDPDSPVRPAKIDRQLTFDRLTNVHYSGTRHAEDQPSHLIVHDTDICRTRCREEYGNPCTRFCPANVYEMVDAGDGTKKLQINASNCVHCKTCDIMDPYQIIDWVPPEGGGGPAVRRHVIDCRTGRSGQRFGRPRLIAAAGDVRLIRGARLRTYRAGASRRRSQHCGSTSSRSGRQPILALWHGRISPVSTTSATAASSSSPARTSTASGSRGIMHRFGYGTARGSTSRGGARALVQLRRELADGRPAAFTVDGPRGPARVAQPGAVWLAGATGHPILPFHIEADRFWTARSWDRTQIPKPFSTVALAIGEPLTVRDTEPASLDAARVRLEDTLAGLEQRALGLLAGRL